MRKIKTKVFISHIHRFDMKKQCKCGRTAKYWTFIRGETTPLQFVCGNHTWWHGCEATKNQESDPEYYTDMKEEYRIHMGR